MKSKISFFNTYVAIESSLQIRGISKGLDLSKNRNVKIIV